MPDKWLIIFVFGFIMFFKDRSTFTFQFSGILLLSPAFFRFNVFYNLLINIVSFSSIFAVLNFFSNYISVIFVVSFKFMCVVFMPDFCKLYVLVWILIRSSFNVYPRWAVLSFQNNMLLFLKIEFNFSENCLQLSSFASVITFSLNSSF